MYSMIRLFTHKRKCVPKIVPLWFKNRNQRAHMGGLMFRGRGPFTRSSTRVKKKVGLFAEGGGLICGGRWLIGGEIRYFRTPEELRQITERLHKFVWLL